MTAVTDHDHDQHHQHAEHTDLGEPAEHSADQGVHGKHSDHAVRKEHTDDGAGVEDADAADQQVGKPAPVEAAEDTADTAGNAGVAEDEHAGDDVSDGERAEGHVADEESREGRRADDDHARVEGDAEPNSDSARVYGDDGRTGVDGDGDTFGRTETERVASGRTETERVASGRTDSGPTGAERVNSVRPEAGRADSVRTESARTESARTAFSRSESESGRTEPRRPESGRTEAASAWDDGLIARRVTEGTAGEHVPVAESRVTSTNASPQAVTPLAFDGPLRSRLDALRELVGLSRTRLDGRTLAEAGRVLDEAQARRRLSGQHTVVAIAGATGSGKSQLFNALAGVNISETGVRRPTTAMPIACSWSDGAASLIDRLGIPGRLRRRPVQSAEAEAQLRGLVLVDLPDHDSAAVQHREQVDRVLALVDAVIWVVDPEKYADAMLHERYLRPLAGHAEVMFIVLNQIDRLPGEATEQVLDDLRRLLDEDGIALGEHGEPGATVLAVSALTGDGLGELRESLGQFVTERGAPGRRIAADVDAAAVRLRSVYATGRRTGLSEQARDEFAARLADSVGATAAGEAAERAWLRNANRACGTPWLRLWRWYQDRSEPTTGRLPLRAQADEEATARQRVEQAVRTVADRASAGLPAPWAQAVREAAVRGSQGLPEALDELATRAGLPPGRPPRPGWWPAAVLAQASMTILQIVGGLWLLGQIIGFMTPNLGVPVLLMGCGIVGGPLVEWSCRMAARGPARRYGTEAERLLREAAAGCGRARVLDPLAAELLRYREVREQYGRVIGAGAAAR
ncbi:GTPase [Streptomyces sp. NPDC087903]|uniref:GTPase n=1 Tax=Streptomyces sp. NPDC087903 TaxID=3365819 RepID=UPI0038188DC6